MRNICIALLILAPIFSGASELLDINYQGVVKSQSKNNVRAEIIKKAVNEVSEKYIIEIIGENKVQKNRAFIETQIINNYLKYIPIIKVSNFAKSGAGEMSADVNLKLSIESLKSLLLKEGLLYELGGAPKVLPMVSITDKVNSRIFTWWTQDNTGERLFLQGLMSGFNKSLKAELWSKGFWGLEPIKTNFTKTVPEVFRSDNSRTEDYLFLGQYFKSSIVVRGSIKIGSENSLGDSYKIDVKLEALQSSNGRVIGEVIRQYETESGPFQAVVNKKFIEMKEIVTKDLVVQILDAWQKGTFGSSLIKLTLKGDMNYMQLEMFKKDVLANIRSIRALRARLFGPKEYTFEVDSSTTSGQLANSFKGQNFPRFKVEVGEVSGNELALDIKVR